MSPEDNLEFRGDIAESTSSVVAEEGYLDRMRSAAAAIAAWCGPPSVKGL